MIKVESTLEILESCASLPMEGHPVTRTMACSVATSENMGL
jgi:hypothetical protein